MYTAGCTGYNICIVQPFLLQWKASDDQTMAYVAGTMLGFSGPDNNIWCANFLTIPKLDVECVEKLDSDMLR